MNYDVDLLAKAHQEIFEAWKWYEKQQTGLGERFEKAIFAKINLITSNPLHYPKKRKYREALASDFPYLIIYKINEEKHLIVVVLVFHTSRHPKRKY